MGEQKMINYLIEHFPQIVQQNMKNFKSANLK